MEWNSQKEFTWFISQFRLENLSVVDYLLPEGNNAIRTNVLSLRLQVKKKRPGRDGKMAGLVPVLYVNQSWLQWCDLTRKFDQPPFHAASLMHSDIMTWLSSFPPSPFFTRPLHRPHFLQQHLHDVSIGSVAGYCAWFVH